MIANKYPQQTSIITKSVGYSFIGFFLLLFFTPFTGLEIGLTIWLSLVAALLLFAYFENIEQPLRERMFYKGYYPPEYNYYRTFMITLIVLYSLALILTRNLILQILSIIVFSLIASLISIIPYLRSSLQNQKFELKDQRKQISELAQKINSITSPSDALKPVQPNYDAKTGEPLVNVTTQELKSTPITLPAPEIVRAKPKVRFDSQTGRPLTDEEMVSQNTEPDEQSFAIKKQKSSSVDIARDYKPVQYNSTGISQQPANQLTKRIFLNISENFAGYLFFGAIIFLFIAGLAWIFVFFPGSTNISIGQQTWIAGDTVVIFGILIVLISEFILGKSSYSDYIPVNYLGIGVGLGISILGLFSIRFDVLSVFLSNSGLIDKNWYFFILSVLVASLSWIYAWRSPYRDLIFGSLISGFVLVDYSLQFPFNLYVLIGAVTGLFFILAPGIHASLAESIDNRFFLGGLIVFGLLMLKTDDLLAIIKINPLVYFVLLLIPAISFSVLFSLKKINNFYLLLCLPISSFGLLVNELSFMNNYISIEIFSAVFVGIVILIALPTVFRLNQHIYLSEIVIINSLVIIGHISFISLQWLSLDGWIVVFVPIAVNIFILLYMIINNSIKFEYLAIMYALTILALGLHLETIGIVPLMLIIALVFSYFIFSKNQSPFMNVSFLITTLAIILLGSIFTVLELWEIITIPLTIPIFVLFSRLYKELHRNTLILSVTSIMVTLVPLTFTQSIFATYIMIEYFIVAALVGFILVIKNQKVESDIYYWLGLYVGFICLFIYADYTLIISYSTFIILSLESFIISVLYIAEFSQKRVQQFLYDITSIIMFTSLFALIILEQFSNEYFLIALVFFLVANLFIVWYLLRYSGMDFTVGIILPALLIIGKELFVTQYLSQQIDPLYSLGEFLLVALSGFCLALFSRRVTEYDALISPTISAMFSVELVLIVLFINKIIIDYTAMITFLLLLGIILVVNFIQKQSLFHIEYGIIVISSLLLAIVIPITKSIDSTYLVAILFSLPIFWFVLRFKIKKLLFIPDAIIFVLLIIAEYIISLQIPNSMLIQSGLIVLQVIGSIAILSFVIEANKYKDRDRFKRLILLQLPFWASVIFFYDLESSMKLFYSAFISYRPIYEMILLNASIIILLIIIAVMFLHDKFEELTPTKNLVIIGIISYSTLGMLLIQSIISLTSLDLFSNGLILLLLLLLVQALSALFIKRDHQIQTFNQLLLVSSFYTIATITLFLLDNGLIAALLSILGTIYVILGITKNFRKEIQLVGAFYIVASISVLLFNILNNFNKFVFEIAISSSILAICLLLLGLIVNYKFMRPKRIREVK